jgi:hypothetical protein
MASGTFRERSWDINTAQCCSRRHASEMNNIAISKLKTLLYLHNLKQKNKDIEIEMEGLLNCVNS